MSTKKMNTKTSEVKEHSEFGGSQAERIINCPGSVALSRGMPNKENAASERGTDAHACLEFFCNNRHALKKKVTRTKVMKKAKANPKWDSAMIEDALHALTWIEEQISPNGVLYVEEKLDTSAFTTDNQSSTLDVGIANYSARELIICDYKYGKYKIKVKKNPQLIYYALGMLLKLKAWKQFERVRLVIIQPNSSGKIISEYTMSVEDCIKWGKKFRKAVKIALKPKAPFKYGDKYCFFCLAKSKCPVMKERMAKNTFQVH